MSIKVGIECSFKKIEKHWKPGSLAHWLNTVESKHKVKKNILVTSQRYVSQAQKDVSITTEENMFIL